MGFFESLFSGLGAIFSGGSTVESDKSDSSLPTYTPSGYKEVNSNTIESRGETFTKGWDGNYHSNGWFSNAKIETDWLGNPKTDFWGNPIVSDD